MRNLLVATTNEHKLDEIKEILSDLPLKILNLRDFNINIDVDENGDSFLANARIKAKEYYKLTQVLTLADDSGLIVPELNNEPGIYSSRYAGNDASDSDNRTKLIQKLKEKDFNHTEAYFVCAMTLFDQEEFSVEGRCYGYVKPFEKGNNGFGYDPMFYLEKNGHSLSEISPEEKNKISHRKMALIKIKKELKDRFFV